MADRYWVGGSGTWDATTTTNWATSTGGAGGASAPTSADNVIFNSASNATLYTVTVGTNAVCADLTAAGPASGNVTFSLGTTARLECYGSMTLAATGVTWTGVGGAFLTFKATTTGKTITTNGVALTLTRVDFDGVGGAWTLGSALTYGTNQSSFIQNGTLNTNNFNITGGAFGKSLAGTCEINLGSSTITVSQATSINISISTGLTLNAGTSAIICSNPSPTFTGGGLTFYNVSFTSAAVGTVTINGANTFNDLTFTSRSATGVRVISISDNQTVSGTLTLGAANTSVRRVQVQSDTIGTQRTITLNGSLATLADCDFRDIAAAGSAGTWTGTRIGNGLNNSGITFDAAKTVYWNFAAGAQWVSTAWATSSGGTVNINNFPLAQDKAIIEDTGLNSGASISFSGGAFWIGELDISTRTLPMTLASGTIGGLVYKNVTLSSAVTMTGTAAWQFVGQGTTQILDVNTATFVPPITIDSPSGTIQLAENTTCSATVTLTQGTLNLNNNVLTANIFSSSNSNTRVIAFGTGNITVTGNNAIIWTTATATNFSYTGTPTVNCTYSGSVGTRTIGSGQLATITEAQALNFNISAGSDTITITTNHSLKNLNFTGFTGTLTSGNRVLYGSLTLGAGMTSTDGTGITTFASTTAQQNITSNGVVLGSPITCSGTQTVQLQDNLTIPSTRTFTLTSGTLDLSSGNRTLSCGLFSSTGSTTRSIAFGTGNITVTGNDAIVYDTNVMTNFSYTGTPTVNFTYSGSTGTRTLRQAPTGNGGTESNVVNMNISAGSDIVSIGGSVRVYKNVNFTGFTGSCTVGLIGFFGNLTFSSGMTVGGTDGAFFSATSGTQLITTNGKTLDFNVTQNGVGGTVQLQDSLTIGSTRTFTLTNGILNVNNFNLTAGLFSSNNSNTRTITMGSGTWTLTGTGTAWNLATTTGLTFNRGTATISMTNGTSQTFAGGGLTYYKLNQGGLELTITGANTFFDISNTVQPTTIIFPASTTTTFNNFSLNGTSGNLVNIQSSTSGTQATIAYLP